MASKGVTWLEIAGLGLVGLSIFSKLSNGSFNPLVMLGKTHSAPAPAPAALPPPPSASAPGVVQAGDSLQLPVGTFEGIDQETSLEDDAANANKLANQLTPNDVSLVADLMTKPGFPVVFLVTKTALTAPGGTIKGAPVAIGIMSTPHLSVRMPFVLPLGAVEKLERNGTVIPTAPPQITLASLSMQL
jgi:hypothetical protein